jgi:hypothetical protein
MLQISPPNQLAKIRRQAKRRGLRVLRDHCGNFSVIGTHTEPPRPLVGLDHVPLWTIEQVLFTPLPEPPPPRRRMARPSAPVEGNASTSTPVVRPFLALVEALKAGGAR